MPYDFSLYLVRFVDDAKVFRFPSNNSYLPGLFREGDFGSELDDAGQKWLATASGFPGDPAAFSVAEVFDPDLVMDDHRVGQLVLVNCDYPAGFAPKSSVTFAEMIRSLPKDKSRIAYIKALQWFNMPKDRDFAAVEMDDEVKRAMAKSIEDQNSD